MPGHKQKATLGPTRTHDQPANVSSETRSLEAKEYAGISMGNLIRRFGCQLSKERAVVVHHFHHIEMTVSGADIGAHHDPVRMGLQQDPPVFLKNQLTIIQALLFERYEPAGVRLERVSAG